VFLLASLVALLLQRQRLVIDKSARTGKAAHIALLLAVWHQFVFVCLQTLHVYKYSLILCIMPKSLFTISVFLFIFEHENSIPQRYHARAV